VRKTLVSPLQLLDREKPIRIREGRKAKTFERKQFHYFQEVEPGYTMIL
jgi:hypothetical protein